MDWKDLQENTMTLTGMAAQKLNELSDMASLHFQLKKLELRLRNLYEQFGKAAYLHFTTDDNGTEAITKYVEAIALTKRDIVSLKKLIKKKQQEKS